MAKPSRELQFSTHQLVGVFLGILVLGVFIFLLGISVGRKETTLTASGGPAAAAKPGLAEVKPPAEDAAKSAIQKEVDVHARADTAGGQPAVKKSGPSAKPADIPALKTGEKPVAKTGEKPTFKPPVKAADKPVQAPAVQTSVPADAIGAGWFIQVAAVTDKPAAAAFAERLKTDGYPARLFEPMAGDKKAVYRVRVGPYPTKTDADAAKTRLTEALKRKKTDFFLVKG